MTATVTDITRIRAVAVRVERRAIAGGCDRDVARLMADIAVDSMRQGKASAGHLLRRHGTKPSDPNGPRAA